MRPGWRRSATQPSCYFALDAHDQSGTSAERVTEKPLFGWSERPRGVNRSSSLNPGELTDLIPEQKGQRYIVKICGIFFASEAL